MKITVHSSKLVKPAYGHRITCGDDNTPAATVLIPLTVFDEVTHDEYNPGVFLFRPPSPPIAALEAGLAEALSEYREWAGRLVVVDDATGKRAICLNDAGVRFIEASADVTLGAVMPLRVGPEAAKLHPSCDDDGGTEELMLVQVTRFPCGSFAVGFTIHHPVADGCATGSFMLAWGQATRGAAAAAAGFVPVPVHDRVSFFVPRHPPLVEFEHRGSEFKLPSTLRDDQKAFEFQDDDDDEVIVETVPFSREFIAQLKSRASAAKQQQSYSAAQCVVAHLWRCITKARGLGGDEVTRLHIAVNGRRRMTNPRVPEGYTGNVVLWARPTTTARELVDDDTKPLRQTVELVSQAVARVDDRYFRSFIDFASSGVVEREGLVRTVVASELVSRNDVEVDSLLGFPIYDLDFGTGKPVLFIPTYSKVEGAIFLVPPPSSGDGGVIAYVSLFRRAVDAFKRCCYFLPLVAEPSKLRNPSSAGFHIGTTNPEIKTSSLVQGHPTKSELGHLVRVGYTNQN